MRSSISAQSLASVPPSRALIVRIAPALSCGPLSSALSSRSATMRLKRRTSLATSAAIESSSSAISSRAVRSSAPRLASSSGPTIDLSDFSSTDHLLGRLLVVPETRGRHPLLRCPRSAVLLPA